MANKRPLYWDTVSGAVKEISDGDTVSPSVLPSGSVSLNIGEATVNFGTGDDTATVTVTGQSWVVSTSKVSCTASGKPTADHDAEDYILENITAIATNYVNGVGFDIVASCSEYETHGQYIITFVGA